MARTPRSATAASSAKAEAAPIDPEAFYRVIASERFEHRRIAFGTIAVAEVRGSILVEVLAGDHASKVAGYAPVPASL